MKTSGCGAAQWSRQRASGGEQTSVNSVSTRPSPRILSSRSHLRQQKQGSERALHHRRDDRRHGGGYRVLHKDREKFDRCRARMIFSRSGSIFLLYFVMFASIRAAAGRHDAAIQEVTYGIQIDG